MLGETAAGSDRRVEERDVEKVSGNNERMASTHLQTYETNKNRVVVESQLKNEFLQSPRWPCVSLILSSSLKLVILLHPGLQN